MRWLSWNGNVECGLITLAINFVEMRSSLMAMYEITNEFVDGSGNAINSFRKSATSLG
jgi:hypothetical protein